MEDFADTNSDECSYSSSDATSEFQATECFMAREINDEFSDDRNSEFGGAIISRIVDHKWVDSGLLLNVSWSTEETSWERYVNLKEDVPLMLTTYITRNNVTRSSRSDRIMSWAKNVVHNHKKALKRVRKLYDFYLSEENNVCYVRRNRKKKKIFSLIKRRKI